MEQHEDEFLFNLTDEKQNKEEQLSINSSDIFDDHQLYTYQIVYEKLNRIIKILDYSIYKNKRQSFDSIYIYMKKSDAIEKMNINYIELKLNSIFEISDLKHTKLKTSYFSKWKTNISKINEHANVDITKKLNKYKEEFQNAKTISTVQKKNLKELDAKLAQYETEIQSLNSECNKLSNTLFDAQQNRDQTKVNISDLEIKINELGKQEEKYREMNVNVDSVNLHKQLEEYKYQNVKIVDEIRQLKEIMSKNDYVIKTFMDDYNHLLDQRNPLNLVKNFAK